MYLAFGSLVKFIIRMWRSFVKLNIDFAAVSGYYDFAKAKAVKFFHGKTNPPIMAYRGILLFAASYTEAFAVNPYQAIC